MMVTQTNYRNFVRATRQTDNCISSSPLPIGGSCTISVTFTAFGAGTDSGTL